MSGLWPPASGRFRWKTLSPISRWRIGPKLPHDARLRGYGLDVCVLGPPLLLLIAPQKTWPGSLGAASRPIAI
jgi:hypothetical protein